MNKAELMKKRKELVERVEAIRADYREGLNSDAEDRALELENRDTMYEIERVTLEEIAKIDKELKELE